MSKSSISNHFLSASGLALSLALAVMPSVAQAQEADSDNADAGKEIVVTGTLIRGAAPVGSQNVGITEQTIVEKGATTTNELITAMPQFASFNGQFETDSRAFGQISLSRINLRNLPGYNSSSGSVTLVMMDGHRITPVGVLEASIDVDIIPAAVLQRVDVVTDGGSSLYGADAVAGVVNFITKRKFEGIKLDANFGFGTEIKGYQQWDASLTAGKSWATGNAFISAGYGMHDGVLNGETSWARQGIWSSAGLAVTGTQCIKPVATVDRFVFLPIFGGIWTDNSQAGGGTRSAPGQTPCDTFSQGSYIPKLTRYTVFGSVTQEVSSNAEFHMTAYYTKLKNFTSTYPRGGSATVAVTGPTGAPGSPGAPASSPFDIINGASFSYGANAAYVNAQQVQGYETFGFTPEVKVSLGNSWQVRGTIHYGQSTNWSRNPGVNTAAQLAAVNAGQLNPNNVAAASASVITNILNYETARDTHHQLFLARIDADGSLFALPGGDAKLAFGAEYQNARAQIRLSEGTVDSINNVAFRKGSRNTKSVYGELFLPVHNILDVSASVRHDDYSDFGSTTNPTLAARLKPVEWLSIFGHWGKSFNAPTVLDTFSSYTLSYLTSPNCSQIPCFNPVTNTTYTSGNVALLNGTAPNLKPQTATTWAIGFNANPVRDLKFGVTYYNIDFRNILGAVNPQNEATKTLNADKYFFGTAAANAAIALLPGAANASTAVPAGFNLNSLVYLVDRRTSNLNSAKLEGLDFHLEYSHPISIGTLSFGLSGNKQLKLHNILGGVIDDAFLQARSGTQSDFAGSVNVGLTTKAVSARVTVNYTGGYTTLDYLNNPLRITPFVQTNLFLGYKFGEDKGALSGMSLRLNVDNLFNALPQIVQLNESNLSYRKWTLGRVIKLGFSKEF